MIWQDLLISLANLVFLISLSTQVIYGFKKRKGLIVISNSLPTAISLFAMAIAFFTLHLYLSTTIALLNGILWLTLFIQRLIYNKS